MTTTTLEPTVLGVLQGTRELLNIPERWTTRFSARSKTNDPIDPMAPGAICWCLLGAVTCQIKDLTGNRPDEHSQLWADTREAFYDTIPDSISTFNDNHTHEEVLALLDKMIEERR